MELALNLVWAVLAVSAMGVWLRFGSRSERRGQFIALSMLLLILFPVISVTDDLQLPQNPAEADCCLRRDHIVSNPHSILPLVSALPEAYISGFSFDAPRFVTLATLDIPRLDGPTLAALQGRAPPAA